MNPGQSFAADAELAGWEAVTMERGDRVTVEVRRGESFVRLVWDCGAYDYAESYREDWGVRRTVRNASATRRFLGMKPGKPPAERKTLKGTRDLEAETAPLRPENNSPFKISQPDQTIISAISGKNISWWDERNRKAKSAFVLPLPKCIKLVRAKGKRVVIFPSENCSISVFVDNIYEVS